MVPERTVKVAMRLLALGAEEISIGDTIGKATPDEVAQLLEALQQAGIDVACLALHVHDTYGRAVDNVMRAYGMGVTTFDTSVAGLGGCPYAPGSPGNVATEKVVQALTEAGHDTGIDLAVLVQARALIGSHLGRVL